MALRVSPDMVSCCFWARLARASRSDVGTRITICSVGSVASLGRPCLARAISSGVPVVLAPKTTQIQFSGYAKPCIRGRFSKTVNR